MKRLVLLLSLVSLTALAEGMNDKEIAEVKAEIAQRKAVVEQMKKEGKATGRYEMTIFRLERQLERLEGMNLPIDKN